MSIKTIKQEVKYYLGRECTDEEAVEIAGYLEDNPAASLDEIIQDYYECE